MILKKYFLEEIKKLQNVEIKYNTHIVKAEKHSDHYGLITNNTNEFMSGFVLNTTYASVNQVLKIFEEDPLKIKYELCIFIYCMYIIIFVFR